MSVISVIVAVVSAVLVPGSAANDGIADRAVPSALIEKLVPKDLALPVCDMALAPQQDDWVRGVLVVWNGEWAVRSVGAGAEKEPTRNNATSISGGTPPVLDTMLAAIVNADSPDGEAARGSNGFATRPIFVALGADAPNGRLIDAIWACAARDVKAPRIWLLARDAEGRVGALPVHLPIDGPNRDLRTEPPVVRWTLKRGDEPVAASNLPGVHELAYALRSAHADSEVALSIEARDPELPAAAHFAIVNECRRFGFRVLFRSIVEAKDSDDAAPHGVAAGAWVTSDPPIEVKAVPPEIVPGKALFGDPRENS